MKLIVGITEAPGVTYGLRLLACLERCPEIETHTVISDRTKLIIESEMNWTPDIVDRVVERAHNASDGVAPFPDASQFDGAIVAPCSVESLAAIANADGKGLLAQAVRACLQRQSPVILFVTEGVLRSEQLELMYRVSRMGAVLLASPAYPLDLVSVDDIVSSTAAAALELAGIRPLKYPPGEGG